MLGKLLLEGGKGPHHPRVIVEGRIGLISRFASSHGGDPETKFFDLSDFRTKIRTILGKISDEKGERKKKENRVAKLWNRGRTMSAERS